ncbi:poly-beta-1,6 N-acetyl-D-glucosamine export porin PgaA [Nitrosophilus alvini]|uniref:poly-beta-1,6 N-acetyl-D-glucosamine export porin PgaA n=1 Tax=Nitrosophilus alvini TaxID=2714855 RepID=UPI00190DFEBC|nr:poly-beta-1,6 N-acetyl-D-glucosamine export porin PgaA [Nitrosophilus alvini]
MRNLLFIFLLLCFTAVTERAKAEIALNYEYAIQMARSGKIAQAIKELEKLYKRNPDFKPILYDYITVLGWGGRDDEAIALSIGLDPLKMPFYTLDALAKSYRNKQEFKKAEFLYKLGTVRFPDNPKFHTGLVLTLTDEGKLREAIERVKNYRKKFSNYTDLIFALAYALEASKRYFEAFVLYQKVLEKNSNHAEGLKGYARMLDMVGLPYLAEKYMKKRPELFSKNDWYRVRKDKAAFKVRWGELLQADEEKRFIETDEAIRMLDAIIAESKARSLKEENPNILQARFDKVVALRDRFKMRDAIKEYEKLEKEDIKMPFYTLAAAADAYLYLKNPEKAQELYMKVLQSMPESPENFEIKIAVFYTYVEMFKLKEAMKWIDEVDKKEPAWRGDTPNFNKTISAITAALARYYSDYMDEAQKRLENLSKIAPANIDIKAELSNVYKDRGWPRKSYEEAEMALSYDINHKNANIIKGLSLLNLQRFKESEKVIYKLYRTYPEDIHVKRAKKFFDIYKNRYELTVDTAVGSSSGKEIGSDHFYIETKLYSKPINYNYRVYVLSYFSRADVYEGLEKYSRYGMAVEYRKNDIKSNIGFVRNENIDKSGWFVDADYCFNDKWKFYGSYEKYSKNTPLRALKNGVYADRADFVLTYRVNESRETNIEFERMDFNDTNRRESFGLRHYERIVTGPYYKLNSTFYYSISYNSENDVYYFSPIRDRYVGIDLENVWHLYRRYSKAFSHVVGITLGDYWVKGSGSETIWAVRYEHRWEADDRFDLIYGISRSRMFYGITETPFYDNGIEYDTSFYLALDWRF